MKRRMHPAGLVAVVLACAAVLPGCGRQGEAEAREAAAPDPGAGGLEPAGTMAGSRAAHTATALPDGRVLLAGGFAGDEGTAAGAEIYDPAAGTFSPAEPMRTPRYGHTATPLPGGRVLLAGGWGAGGEYLSSAELFDPASGTFAPAAELPGARAGHVAVALLDGRVLLVGGVGAGRTFLGTADLYDPAAAAFSSTGAMAVPRENHVAVRLADGRVLVAGGHSGRRPRVTVYDGAEIYDPVAGVFTATGGMGVRRHKHDAVLLPDGRVLVTGGSDERDGDGAYASAELYDAAAGTFSPAGAMSLPRYKHQGTSAVLPDGRVLVAGGAARAEVYDPRTGTFALVGGTARMAGQYSAAAPLGDGRVLVTGGYGEGQPPQSSAWIYRP